MNLLAHIYLSGNSEKFLAGNFIADDIKGKQYLQFEEGIQEGIFLHRKIDAFTDNHEKVRNTVKLLRERFDKYAPVVADIFYDHFLALNWDSFSNISLNNFVHNRYEILAKFRHIFPENMKKVFDAMVENDWLTNYTTLSGIEKALSGIAHRTQYDSNLHDGSQNLIKNFQAYQKDFLSFFPCICNYVDEILTKKGFHLKPEILKV